MLASLRARLLQLCLALCNAVDCSLPGSSVLGILQAGILEWVAVPSSRGASRPRDGTLLSCVGRQVLYHYYHLGSPPHLLLQSGASWVSSQHRKLPYALFIWQILLSV